jgi:hypothetical protein
LQQDHSQEGPNLSRIGSEQVDNCLLQVVKYLPTLFDAFDDGGKVVIQQHHIGSILSYI